MKFLAFLFVVVILIAANVAANEIIRNKTELKGLPYKLAVYFTTVALFGLALGLIAIAALIAGVR
jgi:hypothetical protein